MPAASLQLNTFAPSATPDDAAATRRTGLLDRVFNAIHDAQTKRAEREIARFIERRGGRMTDDLERKIERHFV